ncbi:MAG TPA: PA2169 family four-helix-bundle protein [Chitinophagaceae bacterium]|nr:PA2169 family four-helix-bundle protein [Chitinophagaceae bacterium]
MERNDQVREVLSDLIRINNDRIEGYEKAIQDSKDKDTDLQAMFSRMADESKQYAAELEREVSRSGEEAPSGTTVSGKIYRVWMDIRSAFSGKSRQSVLDLCEYGEDAAQKAYEEALKEDAQLPSDVRQLIVSQKSALKTSHDTIKRYRDMQEGRRSE